MRVVDYLTNESNDPPSELTVSRMSESLGDPYGGGWLEWPAGLPQRVMTVRNVDRAVSLYRANSGNPKWVNANPQIFEVVTNLWNMRKEAGYSNYMF